jgi:hypothetical protein
MPKSWPKKFSASLRSASAGVDGLGGSPGPFAFRPWHPYTAASTLCPRTDAGATLMKIKTGVCGITAAALVAQATAHDRLQPDAIFDIPSDFPEGNDPYACAVDPIAATVDTLDEGDLGRFSVGLAQHSLPPGRL